MRLIYRICLAATLLAGSGSISTALAAGEFPRVGAYWIDHKSKFVDSTHQSQVMKFLSTADVIVIAPDPGTQTNQYRARINSAKSINPQLLVFRYINVTEFNPNWGGWGGVANALGDFVNPNRGGGNTAGDGWLREANGRITTYWPNNNSVNVSDYVSAFNGNGTSVESDVNRPMNGERTVDYMGRVNYFLRVDMNSDFIDGIYEDLFRRYPKVRADWNNDGANEENQEDTDLVTQRKWRDAHVRNRNNMIGINGTGTGAPNARSNGRAWLQNGGYFLGNMSAWSLSWQAQGQMNSGMPMERVSEYENLLHGGAFEGAFGLDYSVGGLHANGTPTSFSGGSLDHALTSFNFPLSHARNIPELGYSATILEGMASTLHMARYVFAAGLLTDGIVNVRLYEGSNSQPPWILDEYVGGDINRMSNSAIHAARKWLGRARNPAYPNNPKSNGGRVHMREFDNGLVVLLAGRSHQDSHMSATVTVNLPNPGAGAEWRRIDGGQDSSWNNGQRVTSVTLGTSANNINKNAIVLRRVGGSGGGSGPVAPKPPVLLPE